MKQFIWNTFRFLLVASACYIVFLFFWGSFAPKIFPSNIIYRKGSNGHMNSRIAEIKNYSNIDILFLGSSHAYRGFDPRVFSANGYTTFNLGSSAQTPIQTKILLERYVDILNPKTVIYEVYPTTFVIDGVESSLDLIANDKIDFSTVHMALQINNIKTYNTLIYGILANLLKPNNFSEPIIRGKDKYIQGGFVEREIEFYKPTLLRKREISFGQHQLENFSEIVKILEEKDIELILVFAPIPKINYKSYTNTDYFNEVMAEYSVYYNFNEPNFLNDSMHFYDSHHLNQNGVVEFNNKLIDVLNKQ